MPQNNERINELIQKGPKLMKADLGEIDFLLTQGDANTAYERMAWTYEAITRIVSTPDYEGDIELTDLD